MVISNIIIIIVLCSIQYSIVYYSIHVSIDVLFILCPGIILFSDVIHSDGAAWLLRRAHMRVLCMRRGAAAAACVYADRRLSLFRFIRLLRLFSPQRNGGEHTLLLPADVADMRRRFVRRMRLRDCRRDRITYCGCLRRILPHLPWLERVAQRNVYQAVDDHRRYGSPDWHRLFTWYLFLPRT
jgi:hypothetical protein